jgi:hypothetical protein
MFRGRDWVAEDARKRMESGKANPAVEVHRLAGDNLKTATGLLPIQKITPNKATYHKARHSMIKQAVS